MPGEINPETMDYLRIQLEGQVRPNVEAALYKYYRNLGSTIVAVLGLVGISLGWPELKRFVKDEVGKQVDEPVAKAVASVKEQQKAIDKSLDKTNNTLERARADASKLESKLDEINDTIIKANQKALNLEEKVKSDSDIVTLNADRVKELDGKYASFGVTQQLSELSKQVDSINKALNQLAQAAGKTNAIIDAQGVSEKLAAIQKQAQTFVAPSDGNSKTTVFVQYAESTRQQIVQLTNKLRQDATFQIPGEERVDAAKGKNEIRYFYQEDLPAVNELKAKTESALSDLGYQPVSIDPKDYLGFAAKPKHKVIELWLELPEKK